MAVNRQEKSSGAPLAIGANVALMIVLAVALVAGLQWIGYSYSARADLTTTGVNSLTPATKRMLADLPEDVRLVSMYFKTDMENEDQDRYRSAVGDLLELYRATNRTKVRVEAINPLKDHDQRKKLLRELAKLSKFKEETKGHDEAVARFRDDLLGRIGGLIRDELAQIDTFGSLQGQDAQLVAQVKQLYGGAQKDLEQSAVEISDALAADVPAYSAAVAGIRQTYTSVTRLLESITKVGQQLASSPGQLSPAIEAYFVEASKRYADLLAALAEEQTRLQTLPVLSLDDVLRELRSETGNPILVATADDAKVVSFRDVWPPSDPRQPAAGFGNRRFLGEQKLTSAILQLTQKEKPAVVFVRFGGPPLFFGGFMPGQSQAPYAEMKTQLEDANFTVHEWDLAAQDAMPAIDPAPTRTIFVVLRPVPPQPGQFGQPPQEPSFSPQNLETVKKALGGSPRAIFLTGWLPTRGPMPGEYEYAEYLSSTWGLDATGRRLLFFVEPVGAGKYRFVRQPWDMLDPRYADHPVVKTLSQSRATFPLVSPIDIAEKLPEGVEVERLAWFPQEDGLWSIGDVSYYLNQQRNEYIVRNATDYTGDFTMAVAATNGDGKLVLVSSTDFATDDVALASEMVFTSQGLAVRPRNPGNAALFINALHWLNDNTEWMDLGTPIDAAAIAVDKDSAAMTFVRVLVLALWPGLALCGGLVMWMVRRR